MGTKSPTAAQLDFARQLGIDIPAGTSRTQLSQLISHAKNRDKSVQHGLDRHPNAAALPAAAGIDKHESGPDQIRQASRVLRRQRVHVGSVVSYFYADSPFVVIGIERCQLLVQKVEGQQVKTRMDILPKGHGPGDPDPFKLIFNPPERFLHRFCFRHNLRLLADEERRNPMYRFKSREVCYRVVERYLEDVAWSLDSIHKIQTAYGDFWQRDAVDARVERDFIQYLRDKATN